VIRALQLALFSKVDVTAKASGLLFLYLRAGGLVLLQVGTELVTPTEGQLYDPTDGAVTVPTEFPDAP
jgi:hypothetical protein